MSDSKIKKCPFCGADARINSIRLSVSEVEYYIDCASGCVQQSFPFMTKEEAIEDWNKRDYETHGYWDDSADGITPYCSVCGQSHRCLKRKPNYCPNCGAKMDEPVGNSNKSEEAQG